jgi:lipopolysaccharide transport system ATP-binding protein
VPDAEEQGHRLLAVRLLGAAGQPTTQAKIGETVGVQVFFRTSPEESGHIALVIKNRYDQIVTSTGTYLLGGEPCSSGGDRFSVLEIEVDLVLEAGPYSLMVNFGNPVGANRGVVLDQTDWLGPLQIGWDYEAARAPFLGMFGLPVRARALSSTEWGVAVGKPNEAPESGALLPARAMTSQAMT